MWPFRTRQYKQYFGNLPASCFGSERCDRLLDRCAGTPRRRGYCRPLFERAQQWRVVETGAERHKAPVLAHRFDQPLLAPVEDFQGQSLEVTEDPKQVNSLEERGFQIAWPERCMNSQHAAKYLFKPHGIRFLLKAKEIGAILRPRIIALKPEQWEAQFETFLPVFVAEF